MINLNKNTQFFLLFFCISILSINIVSASEIYNNPLINLDTCETNNNSVSFDDEVLVQKLKTALTSIYKERKLEFINFSSEKSGEEITLNGTIKFYREDISVSTIFSTNGTLLSLSGKLQPGKTLSDRKFKFLTKSNKGLAKWFPKTLQKSIALDNINIAFDKTTQKPKEIVIAISTVNSWKIINNGMLTFNTITGELKTENPTGSTKVTATLGGDLKIGTTTIKSSATIGNSKEAWAFDGELKDLSITEMLCSTHKCNKLII